VGSIKFFQNSICAFAGLTLAYWVCVLVGASQNTGTALVFFFAIIFWIVSALSRKHENDKKGNEFVCMLVLSCAVAAAATFLYAFNPDDSTFFHRFAYLRLNGEIFSPAYDTRIAFDKVAPISAAHLITSWEFALTTVGAGLGSEVLGYQVGGTLVSIILYTFAVNYTVSHFFPNSSASIRVFTAASVILFLFFDADLNRRIGAWLFLGGWTGKCFLSAALIILFPSFDKAYETNRPKDWFFAFCVMVFFVGLTGSSLFILPLALGVLVFIELIFHKGVKLRPTSLFVSAVPLFVGGVFIYKFGSLRDDSYWRGFEAMAFSDYVWLCLSGKALFMYLFLIPIFLCKAIDIKKSRLLRFSVYQLLLAAFLLNPLFYPLFFKLVPSDGFWRVYYLFQYPTVVAILVGTTLEYIKMGSYKKAFTLGAIYIALVIAGGSVISLQAQWGYPHHFKNFLAEKLSEAELVSVKQSAKKCARYEGFSVLLAPEQWEVTAQMLEPSLSSVAARHMQHNFSNTDASQITVPESVRIGARNFVSGLPGGSDKDFEFFIKKEISLIVLRPQIESSAIPMLGEYRKVFSDDNYVVFCRN
jgi:hypothetical protein